MDMSRVFQHLRLSREACAGMREAIRPFASAGRSDDMVLFCDRLYLAFYSLEADPDLESVDFPIDVDEVMLINNFVSAEEGDWAKDLLHQTRQALYEWRAGKDAVRLATSDETNRLLEGIHIDLDSKEGQS